MGIDLTIPWPQKRDLFGVQVSATRYDEAVEAVVSSAAAGRGGVATFLAVHGIVTAVTDEEYRTRVNRCQIVGPDGQPVRWAMNFFQRTALRDRVYGPEMMRRICKRCEEEGLSIFLCGSTPQVLALLAARLLEMFPKLKIAGVESPPFRPMTEAEDQALCDRINRARPAVVFVGLGVPRQEHFADRNRNRIRAVQVCVGAAFDFHAGKKKFAPRFMQQRGLEWLYRLCQEPVRLWRRYLVTNTIFIWLVVTKVLKFFFHRRAVPQGVGA